MKRMLMRGTCFFVLACARALIAAPQMADVCAHIKQLLVTNPRQFKPVEIIELIKPGLLATYRRGPLGSFPYDYAAQLVMAPGSSGAFVFEQTDDGCSVKGVSFLTAAEFAQGHVFGQEAEFRVIADADGNLDYVLATKAAVFGTELKFESAPTEPGQEPAPEAPVFDVGDQGGTPSSDDGLMVIDDGASSESTGEESTTDTDSTGDQVSDDSSTTDEKPAPPSGQTGGAPSSDDDSGLLVIDDGASADGNSAEGSSDDSDDSAAKADVPSAEFENEPPADADDASSAESTDVGGADSDDDLVIIDEQPTAGAAADGSTSAVQTPSSKPAASKMEKPDVKKPDVTKPVAVKAAPEKTDETSDDDDSGSQPAVSTGDGDDGSGDLVIVDEGTTMPSTPSAGAGAQEPAEKKEEAGDQPEEPTEPTKEEEEAEGGVKELRSAIIVSSSAELDEIFGLTNIKPGFTVRTRIAPVAGTPMGDVILQLGLIKGIVATIFVPAGATKRSQVQTNFDFKIDEKSYKGKVLCLLKMGESMVSALLNKSSDADVSKMFDVCVRVDDIGILPEQGTASRTFFIRGQPLDKDGRSLGQEAMIKVWRETTTCSMVTPPEPAKSEKEPGEHAAEGKEAAVGQAAEKEPVKHEVGEKEGAPQDAGKKEPAEKAKSKPCVFQRFAFGYRAGADVRLDSIHPLLRVFDVLPIKDPAIFITNARKATLFDVDPKTHKINKKLPGAFKISRGMSVTALVTSARALSDVLGPQAGADANLQLVMRIPFAEKNKQKEQEERVTADLTRADGRPFTWCLADAPGFAAFKNMHIPGMPNFSAICVSPKVITLSAGRHTGMSLEFDGEVMLGAGRMHMHLVADRGERPEDTHVSAILRHIAGTSAQVCLTDVLKGAPSSSVPILGQLLSACVEPTTISIETHAGVGPTIEFDGFAKIGEARAPVTLRMWEQEGKERYALAARASGQYSLAGASSLFASVADQLSLKDVRIALTNAAEPYDMDLAYDDKTIKVSVEPGITIEAEPVFQGQLKALVGHLPGGTKRLRIKMHAPLKTPLAPADIHMAIDLVDNEDKTHPIEMCLNKMPGLATFAQKSLPIVSQILGTCMTVEAINTRFDSTHGFMFEIAGPVEIKNVGRADIALSLARDGVMVALKFTNLSFGALSSELRPIDAFVGLSEAHIFISTLPGDEPVKPGFTLQAVTRTSDDSSVGNFLRPFGVTAATATVHIPLDVKSTSEALGYLTDINFTLVQGDGKGICPGVALGGQGDDQDSPPPSILTQMCMHTSFGLLPGFKGIWMSGEPFIADKKIGSQAMAKVWKAKDGKIQVAVGIRFDGQQKPGDIDGRLSFLNDLSLTNPVLAYSRAAEPVDLFDVEFAADGVGKLNPKLPSLVVARQGLTIAADVAPAGKIGELIGHVTSGVALRANVSVPLKRDLKPEDVQVTLAVVRDGGISVCASNLGLNAAPLKPFLGGQEFCVQLTGFDVAWLSGVMTLIGNGAIRLGGQDVTGTIVYQPGGEKPGALALWQGNGTFDLGNLGPGANFLSGIVELSDPIVAFANTEMNVEQLSSYVPALRAAKDVLTDVDTGVSIAARANFGSKQSPFAQVLNLFGLKDIEVIVSADPHVAGSYQLEAHKQYDSPEKVAGDLLEVKGLSFVLAGGPPPAMSLIVDALLKIPGLLDQSALSLTSTITGPEFSLMGALACLKDSCPSLHLGSPFPLNLTLAATKDMPISIMLHTASGAIIGFGGSGVFQIEDLSGQVAFNINPAKIAESGIKGKFNRLCLDQTFKLAGKLLGNIAGVDFNVPNVLCVTDATFSAAQQHVQIGAIDISPGLTVTGQLDATPLPLHGSVRVRVVPPGLMAFLTRPGEVGLKATAQLDPLNLGPLHVTASEGTGGPSLTAQATLGKQEIVIDGKVSLAGVFGGKARIAIAPQGIQITMQETRAGIAATIEIVAAIEHIDQARVTYTLDAQATMSAVNQGVQVAINAALEPARQALRGMKDLNNQITSICGKLPGPVADACDSITQPAQEILKQAQDINDELDKVAQEALSFSLDEVKLTGTLSDVVKLTMPQLTAKLRVFGNDQTIEIKDISLEDPTSVPTRLVQALVPILTKNLVADLGKLSEQMAGFAAQAAEKAAEGMAKALFQSAVNVVGKGVGLTTDVAATVFTGIAGLVGAQDAVGAVFSGLDDAENAVNAEADKAINAALDGATAAVNVAKDAAQAAANVAKDVAAVAEQVATEVAGAVKEAAQAVAQEVERLAKAVLKIFCFGFC